MGLKYKRNTSGWTPTKEDNLINNDDPWTADFRVRKESKKKKEGQTDGKGKLKTLEIEAYTERGDFFIKEPGTERSILRYNGRTDEIVINDEEKFEEYFAGSKEKEKRLNKIKKITMKDILAIAESEVNLAEQRQRLDLSPRRDAKRLRRVFEKLEAKPGYKSLFNTAEPAEISEATSQDKGKKDKGPNTPKDGKVSANVDVEKSINSSNSGFTNSFQNSGSGNRIDTESDIVKSSVVSLDMPVEAPPISSVKMGLMRYPIIPPPFGYDHIKISAYTYVEAGLNKQQAETTKDLKSRFTDHKGDVVLPMQPNLSETNSVDWGGDKINALQLAAAGVAMEGITKIGNLDIVGALKGMVDKAGEEINAALGDPETKQAVAAYFAGQAVGANVLTRATGTVINPNLELLFSGPRLRTFNFNFTLTPRSDDEAIMIRKIIRFFKLTSAPIISSSGNFLETPCVYTLQYIFDDEAGEAQHPYLNKFKPCALTQFDVNYTPDGSYSTYKTGSMTSYSIRMAFGELQPIYAGDHINSSENDMGF